MITVRPGSHVHRLITVLGLAGEYPVRSLGVLGNERTLRALVSKLSTTQELRNPDTGERMRVKLLQLTGIGNAKAIRFCKGALPILEWIHPDAYGYYMAAFYNHRFPGGMAHRDRNLRVAETIGMHLTAGIETRVYLLPALQNRAILRITPDAPAFYLARDFKKITPAEQNKTMFTRIVGAIFYPGGLLRRLQHAERRDEMERHGRVQGAPQPDRACPHECRGSEHRLRNPAGRVL